MLTSDEMVKFQGKLSLYVITHGAVQAYVGQEINK
jgi:hypothetical protein